MLARFLKVASLVPFAWTGAGCDHHAFSPPARALPLETVAPLPYGATGIQVEGGTHQTIFGPSVDSGTARVRRGVGDDTDVSVEASVLHVTGDSAVGTKPDVLTGRIGFKHRVLPFLAFTAGVGGGDSTGGGFVSPDIGAIVAYENPYVVPFFSVRGSLSQPIGARPVNTTGVTDTSSYVNTPQLTWIYGATLGLRIPLGWRADDRVRGSLLGGIGLTALGDRIDSYALMSASAGAEIVF